VSEVCGEAGAGAMKKNHSTDHQEWLVQELADPELAALYLTAALEDSPEMFLEALKNIAQTKHKSVQM
jgi:DNA-binding phage protein